MTENEKMDVALFRYSIISDIVNSSHLDYGKQETIIEEKCAKKWVIPHSEKTRISRSVVLRWLKLYRDSGNDIKSLFPKDRCDKGKPRALTEDSMLGLISLRKEMPDATVASLIDQMNRVIWSPPERIFGTRRFTGFRNIGTNIGTTNIGTGE